MLLPPCRYDRRADHRQAAPTSAAMRFGFAAGSAFRFDNYYYKKPPRDLIAAHQTEPRSIGWPSILRVAEMMHARIMRGISRLPCMHATDIVGAHLYRTRWPVALTGVLAEAAARDAAIHATLIK
jgi:hypothetical protein